MCRAINVLSLFDGISCGQLALERAGIPVKTYYASEIKECAMKVTQQNYPNTVQVGDVTKWETWNIPWGEIDLLIGGSPCQDFSTANKERKGLEGSKSSLFYCYYEILQHLKRINPKCRFLLENVRMEKRWENLLSDMLGVRPAVIDSKDFCAMLRYRLYWFDFKVKRMGLLPLYRSDIFPYTPSKLKLADILESGYTDREKQLTLMRRSYVALTNNAGEVYPSFHKRIANAFMPVCYTEPDYNLQSARMHTQIEMERLQTIPDGYTSCISWRDASDCIGDGWTVEVIAHIFKGLKEYLQNESDATNK